MTGESSCRTKSSLVCAAGLKRPPTPINIFEDECAFCHSFRISEFHGPMVQCLNGKLVSAGEGNLSNIIYVHQKCMEWAPRVCFDDDIIMNLESEINRASKLRCNRCRRPGAALGCYNKRCKKSFHVPCALIVASDAGCRWDVDNRLVLCPQHGSEVLPCDPKSSPRKTSDDLYSVPTFQASPNIIDQGISAIHKGLNQQKDQLNTSSSSSLPQGEYLDKKGISSIHTRVDEQVDQPNTSSCPQGVTEQVDQMNTSSSSLPQGECLDKQAISAIDKRVDEQVDQLNTSSSSLPQGECLDKLGISANHKRVDEQVDQLNISSSSLPQRQCADNEGTFDNYQRRQTQTDQHCTSSCPRDQWVLLGAVLTASEKDSLKQFASLTNATVAKEWDNTVTHVIVSTRAGSACGRSYEVLMAILSGKWVVSTRWIVNILGSTPGPETSFEVQFFHGPCTSIDGPKEGRIRAAEGGPKLFTGLLFYISAYMKPEESKHIRDLVAAAGGQVLDGNGLHSPLQNLGKNSVKPYFVYDVSPPEKFRLDALRKEMNEWEMYLIAGADPVSNRRFYDAIASYDRHFLDHMHRNNVLDGSVREHTHP